MIDLSAWLTKAETCQRLGIAERTLDRWVEENRIERRARPAAGRRPVPVHNPQDIAKLETREPAVEIEKPISPSISSPLSQIATPGGEIPLTAGMLVAFVAQLARLVEQAIAEPEPARYRVRHWMTIAEAADYCGLSQACLRRMVRERQIDGFRDGATKVRKSDLDALAARPGAV
jgi:excisionase family DNA binding protein